MTDPTTLDLTGTMPPGTFPTPPTNIPGAASTTTTTPTTNVTSPQNDFVRNLEQQQATNPTLSPNTTITAEQLQNTPDTTLNSPGSQLNGSVAAPLTSAGQSAQVNPNQFDVTAAQYGASTGNNVATGTAAQSAPAPTVTAAQGQVTPDMTVAGQFQKLTSSTADDKVPDWARNAVNQAGSAMAGRGLGSSSIAQGAVTSAVFGAALPIAAQDAGANLQMGLANLNNQQQAVLQNANMQMQTNLANLSAEQQQEMQNVQNKQAGLLSDQSAENAAKQFNATSANQTAQFMASLASQIATQNAARTDAMSQFNSGQANALAQFNSTLDNQRQQFNAANQLTIDQSNANWRRTINTTNTAADNAANQANAQNLFNLSANAQNNLWQQWRDEATWANLDSQNDKTRQTNMAIASLGASTAFGLNNQIFQNEAMQQLGSFGTNVLSSNSGSIFSGIGSLFNGF